MKLDTALERYKIIGGLIKKSFKLDALWVHDEENFNDWASNMEISDKLIAIQKLIYAEKIFIDVFDEIDEVHTRNLKEQKIFLSIVYENLTRFVDEILLQLIENTYDKLSDWQFKTEIGKKFHKDVSKKLDALIKKYQDLYDL